MGNTQVLPTESVTSQILRALENPKYVWRTISGLEKETQLPTEQIVTTLTTLPEDILVIGRGSGGKKLYTTREHYRKAQSWAGKLLSALSDSVK